MSWYKNDKEAWKEIIETVAAEERRTTQMVEKDTIAIVADSDVFLYTNGNK